MRSAYPIMNPSPSRNAAETPPLEPGMAESENNPLSDEEQRYLVETARRFIETFGDSIREDPSPENMTRIARQAMGQHELVEYEPACIKGCNHCCHQRVEVTDFEALVLSHVVVQRPELRERLEQDTGDACPFLVDEECSVYDFRPAVCRAAASPDAELCRRRFRLGEQLPSQRTRSSRLTVVMAAAVDAAVNHLLGKESKSQYAEIREAVLEILDS